jgi:hypothetical protein
MLSRYERMGMWEVDELSVSQLLESHRTLNAKVIGFGVWFLEMVQMCGDNTYEQRESGRGERR